MAKVEINCTNCRTESFLQRDALYEGLTKTGESLSCSACGHVYPNEDAVPFLYETPKAIVFTDADRSQNPNIFSNTEAENLCRYCASYIVNPFTQFCARHKKEVQATDSCPQFKKREDNSDSECTL
jgi:uncharacterized protein YbaR (Trm112 family)